MMGHREDGMARRGLGLANPMKEPEYSNEEANPRHIGNSGSWRRIRTGRLHMFWIYYVTFVGLPSHHPSDLLYFFVFVFCRRGDDETATDSIGFRELKSEIEGQKRKDVLRIGQIMQFI